MSHPSSNDVRPLRNWSWESVMFEPKSTRITASKTIFILSPKTSDSSSTIVADWWILLFFVGIAISILSVRRTFLSVSSSSIATRSVGFLGTPETTLVTDDSTFSISSPKGSRRGTALRADWNEWIGSSLSFVIAAAVGRTWTSTARSDRFRRWTHRGRRI